MIPLDREFASRYQKWAVFDCKMNPSIDTGSRIAIVTSGDPLACSLRVVLIVQYDHTTNRLFPRQHRSLKITDVTG